VGHEDPTGESVNHLIGDLPKDGLIAHVLIGDPGNARDYPGDWPLGIDQRIEDHPHRPAGQYRYGNLDDAVTA
jgi:hypothetical protein